MTQTSKYNIGLIIYPNMTQLDITGPHQVFSFMPNSSIYFVWKNQEPVTSDRGLTILPNTTFNDCPPLDLICVPGGPGQVAMMEDNEMLTFLKKQSQNAQLITSVCTGSLILAAAGLLDGYRATCHWAFLDHLALFNVEVSNERVVIDRNRITGGGVTAGIDFGLVVVSQLLGEEMAKMIQLLLQYDPQPPFNTGTPENADQSLVKQVQILGKDLIKSSLSVSQKLTNK
ncbi:ThiJ/PfpI domain protein [Rippkaea orientalis PCC 8801]|uniref:ThiJ/PfpI domain protein n=1 Tax=Rippkaea orientalis (strain PCC 8801 / RF-1) TaxID=41431 RepID=B7K193_RIPO1|nr:DJ-1/PfpI family protein [Rippkaea orientalis]ACK66288.1 ThiJ/PfpI domain protein [Rippkaea orientalis PCC 8801]